MALDVIFVASPDAAWEKPRLDRLLAGLPELGRLVVLANTDAVATHASVATHGAQPFLHLSRSSEVKDLNRALLSTTVDVLVLGEGVTVSGTGVVGLAAALRCGDRHAAAVPAPVESEEPALADLSSNELPESVEMAGPDLPCLLLRREVLDVVGALDETFPSFSEALTDWCLRAQRLGFVTVRAPRVVAVANREVSVGFTGSRAIALRHSGWNVVKHLSEIDPGAAVTHRALKHARGSTSVCIDVRYLPEDAINGTGVYAVELVRALVKHTPTRVSLLTMTERQKEKLAPLGVPVYLESQQVPEVQVVHRPAQVFRSRELNWLVQSPTPFVITFQDLIAYRAPSAFPDPSDYELYRMVSHLAVRAAQAVVAISEHNRQDLVREFHLPPETVRVVHHGVHATAFADRSKESNLATLSRRGITGPYFLFVGSDYAHKNLRTLFAAWAELRAGWRHQGPTPELVLVGHPSGTADGVYPMLRQQPMHGVHYLGGVSDEEVRALFQESLALVFPSVFEGFGLPLLEAMAAGTPVVTTRFSSIPEVAADAALYVDPLSAPGLAKAMTEIATNQELRQNLIARGHERVKSFTWEAAAKKTFAVYEQAVRRPSALSLHDRRIASAVAGRYLA